MTAIQITMDEELLRRLDEDDDVRALGRSAVLRRAVAEYLARRRQQRIAAAYRQAYATAPGLGREFEGWEREGAWPEE
ncbi:MAG: ribbon-helix-helix protein, CopG family [Vicinamibacteraceae bacterium]